MLDMINFLTTSTSANICVYLQSVCSEALECVFVLKFVLLMKDRWVSNTPSVWNHLLVCMLKIYKIAFKYSVSWLVNTVQVLFCLGLNGNFECFLRYSPHFMCRPCYLQVVALYLLLFSGIRDYKITYLIVQVL